MNKKYLLGLMLIVSLIALPGALAHPTGSMPAPTSNTGVTGCNSCHSPVTTFCKSCHAFPTFSLSVSANPTTVAAGKLTSVTFTVSGSNNIKSTKSAASGAKITLTGAGVSASGTTNTAGIVTIPVNPTGSGSIIATATMAGFNSATVTITATASTPSPVLTTITVTPSTANVLVGATQTFAAAPKDQNGKAIAAAITWTSSNKSVGTIDASGKFKALAAGTTTIKAANGTVSGTSQVTVTTTASVPVLTTITVTPSTANVLVGATQAFAAAPKDQNGKAIAAAITWTSSNKSVGTIDASGKFKALAAGTTTIKAANGTVNGTATVTVIAPSTSYKYYIVTFVVTDKVTGKPIHDAKISMDGIKKETNRYGTAVFNKVSMGNHKYNIKTKHYKKIEGTIKVDKKMKLSVKLVPVNEKKEHEEHDEDEEHDENGEHD